MATKQPFGQSRNQQSRDWGNFNALTDCPNASGWAGAPTSGLEAGDTAPCSVDITKFQIRRLDTGLL